MARNFFTPINLNGLELQGAAIGNLSTTSINAITSGTGRIQYDSTLNVLKYRDNTGWQTVSTGGGSFTLGSTSISLGSTTTTIAGLSSVTSTTFVGALTGNASTATTLATPRAINGTNFDGSAAITVTAAASTLTGSSLNSGVTASSLTSVGTLTGLTMGGNLAMGTNNITGTGSIAATTFTGALTGNASTATALATPRAINGTNFDGTAAITITAAAGTLTGATLASGVTASSLTSVGTLTGLTMSGAIAMGNSKVTGLATPTADTDAATKLYVDTVSAGINVHEAVKYATTGALGTTGNLVGGTITTTYANGTSGLNATLTIATSSNWTEITIDGQSLTVTDRVLIKNQAADLQNGIYTVTSVGAVGNTTSFVFTRAVDNDQSPEIDAGDLTYVIAGTANAGDGYVQTTADIIVGTTGVVWTQFSGAGAVPYASTTVAGIASFDTNTFTVGATGAVSVKSAGISVGQGGTGASTLTGVLKGNGTSAITAATAGTDYLAPPSGTSILKANSGGALANATAGTDYIAPYGSTTANTFLAAPNGSAGTPTFRAVVYADLPTNVGVVARKVSLVGTGSGTTIALTHGLGTNLVTAQVYDTSTSTATLVETDITVTSTVATATFASTTTLSDYTLVVIG